MFGAMNFVRLKDRLTMTSCFDAIHASYAQVSAVQQLSPATQVAGAALLFSTMCEAAGLDVSQVLNQVERMKHDAQETDATMTELRALRMYITNELKS